MNLVTTHVNSDIDAIASLVAVRLLVGPAELVVPGSMDPNARRIWDENEAALPKLTPLRQVLKRLEKDRGGKLYVADTADPARIGAVANYLERFEEVVAWDTHPEDSGDLPRATLPAAAACISGLVLSLHERGLIPTPIQAGLFLVGIHEDSGHFTFPETTDVDHRAAALCLSWGADPRWTSRYIPRGYTGHQLKLMEAMTRSSSLQTTAVGTLAVLNLELEHYEPQLSTLVGELLGAEQWAAAFLVASLEGRIYIIGRSDGWIDASSVLRRIGGGGHPGAASATVKGVTNRGALLLLSQSIEEECEGTLTAGRIAVRNFVSLAEDRSIREASDLMHRHRINAIPLTRGEARSRRFVGLVSRQEVDAAQRHGLGDRQVSEISATSPDWVSPDKSIAEARSRLVSGSGRLIIVGEPPDRVVGIITRKALLLAGAADPPLAPKRRAPNPQVLLDMARRSLRDAWPVIDQLGQLASSEGMSVHMVGGSVRDTLLGRQIRDIDLVVEGSAPDLARLAAERLGGRVHVHEPFATARYSPENAPAIDLATARSEYYESPAALPRILHAELRRDLYRRDFTINAMAISLTPPETGKLRDPYNGYDDLRTRMLRVLHGLSFHDDPTRAFRAARFAARFDFRLAPQTEGLLRSALRSGVFELLGRERLGQEIEALLDETEVEQALRLLRDWNLLGLIHPKFEAGRGFFDRITAVGNARHEMRGIRGEEPSSEFPSAAEVLWVVMAAAVPSDERRGLARLVPRSGVRPHRWSESPARVQAALTRLSHGLSNSEVARIFDGLSLTERIVALGLADSEDARNALRWWEREGRRIRTVVDGSALIELGASPGPAMGRALRLAQAAAWDGAGADVQLACARQALFEDSHAPSDDPDEGADQ